MNDKFIALCRVIWMMVIQVKEGGGTYIQTDDKERVARLFCIAATKAKLDYRSWWVNEHPYVFFCPHKDS